MKTLALAVAAAATFGLAALSLGATPANATTFAAKNAAPFGQTDVVKAHYRRYYHRHYSRYRHCRWWRGHRYCR